MLQPSLHALYKQGRFRRTLPAESDEGMRQVERFAVAMLGFVLHHDSEFRKCFLREICKCDDESELASYVCGLEIPNCGDLVLRKRDDSRAYVFECKVDAPIQDWNQDPNREEFFTTGYGKGMCARWPRGSTFFLLRNEFTPILPKGQSWFAEQLHGVTFRDFPQRIRW